MYRTPARAPAVRHETLSPGATGAACAMFPIALYLAMFDLQHDAGVGTSGGITWVPVMVLCSLVAGAMGYALTDRPRRR